MNLNHVFDNVILRGVVGSTAYGTAIGEGVADRDEMGVFIEPPQYVCGLSPLEHYIKRDQPVGVRSQPGDLDLSMYSLRKFVGLAAKGNPTVVELLWLPEYELESIPGYNLIKMRQKFISRESGCRFLGYLQAQRKRLTGELSRNVSRPDVVEKYGYDTKFAMHALRLGYEGIELLEYGKLTLPIKEPELSVLRAMRMGEIKYEFALDLILGVESELKELVDNCDLEVDYEYINQWLVDVHQEWWRIHEA